MTLCYNIDTFEQVEIPDAQLDMWRETNNPKINYYLPVPPKPAENAVWSSGVWVIPEPVIPENVSARQIRLWLVQHGYSLDAVAAAIAAIPDQNQRAVIQIEWEYAPYIERAHPMLGPMAAVLGLSAQDIDQAFCEAANL
jgi:hypothetical protein